MWTCSIVRSVETAKSDGGIVKLCKPFFLSSRLFGLALCSKGIVMLTEQDIFLDEYLNNEEFRNSFEEYKKNYLSSSSSTVVSSDDLITLNGSLTELDHEQEEQETQNETIVVYDNTDYSEHLNGLLQNTYFIVYFLFAFFVFGALCLVIKFLKSFF